MRSFTAMLAMAGLAVFVATTSGRTLLNSAVVFQTMTRASAPIALRPNSLCAKAEHIIFNCQTKNAVKRLSRSPGKIVSLCASADLDRERGYLQYRYGLPGKIELEFPQSRAGTQQLFHYKHYFRFQIDLTEISFDIDGYQYSVFDDYNGEEKLAIATAGVSVTAPGKEKEVSFVCRGEVKADYSTLPDILPGGQE